jgi:acyl dehydratase
MTTCSEEFLKKLKSFIGESHGPYHSWDEVNQPMIRHFAEAMGDRNPVYQNPEYANGSIHKGVVAPPTMMQAWTMKGYTNEYVEGSDTKNGFDAFDFLYENGFTGVVAVNCEQEYMRYLKLGDSLHYKVAIDVISDEKTTGLGVGFFINQQYSFYDQYDDIVGTMLFRTLRFKPAKSK